MRIIKNFIEIFSLSFRIQDTKVRIFFSNIRLYKMKFRLELMRRQYRQSIKNVTDSDDV